MTGFGGVSVRMQAHASKAGVYNRLSQLKVRGGDLAVTNQAVFYHRKGNSVSHKPNPNLAISLLAMIFVLCTAVPWHATSTGATSAQASNLSSPYPQSATEFSPIPNPEEPSSTTAAGDPLLYFSDITSGPKSGNSDTSDGRSGLDGAIVTLWGRNLGGAQGSSKVYVNGVEAASTYTWGNAATPADLYTYHQMQMISIQVSRFAQDGLGSIYVIVNGRLSNSLPFTVRTGNIYFSTLGGNDDTGDGSWSNPWRTIPKAADSLSPGDIAYIGDGVDQFAETNYGAAVNLGSDGEPGRPKALIVYPGATSNVGNDTLGKAFHVWNENTGGYSVYWVMAKFRMTTAEVGVTAQAGFRVIGNYVTAPNGDGMDGAVGGRNGSDIYILGNELENVGSANCSKLYHSIYITGARQDNPPRAPTESNREVAWNYVHDNLSNRGINIYSEQEYSAYIQQNRVHDNVIVNQRGDGILLGYYVIGDNWVYNNLIVNAGLGPEWSDDASYHTGLRIDTGHETISPTTVYIYNNTLYGNGWSGAVLPDESGSLLVSPEALTRSTTVYFSNNILYSTGEPYIAGESASLPMGDYRNCWYGDGSAPGWDTTAINDDPDFVGTGIFNFQLQNGSPCMEVGKNVSAVVTSDILGVPRPQGLAFDIGAYEYVTATIGLTTAIYLPLIFRAGGAPIPTSTPTATPTTISTPIATPTATSTPGADNPNPPASPVKLIFVHHSTGGNWLADPAGNELGGDLGRALMDNNYFVSATNYGWTVNGDAIGDRTDIGNWWEWFRGPTSATILAALYVETGQNFDDYGSWPRLASDPGGENEIVVFKSCFPNSALQGDPSAAPPPIASNPLRGQDAYSQYHTVANAKGIYIDLLEYFRTRQDKLFVVIAAPPLMDGTWASNARAFNDWLVNDWLSGYPYDERGGLRLLQRSDQQRRRPQHQ